MTETTGLMSPEQIEQRIHQLAKEGDDASARWALKLLHSQRQGETGIPAPLNAAEMIERLARVMRPAGREQCQVAYRKAFPYGPRMNLGIVAAEVRAQHLSNEIKAEILKVRTLRDLYRHYPTIKRSGVPKGYPRSKGQEVVAAFLQRIATQIEVDRMNDTLKDEDVTTTSESGPAKRPLVGFSG